MRFDTGQAVLQVGIDADDSVAVLPEGDLADAAAAAGTVLALNLSNADVDALLWQAASVIAERQLGAIQNPGNTIAHWQRRHS